MTKKKNKIQGIDEFYCINLKHRKDKKKLVLREFKKLNLEKKIKFVDGVFVAKN